ncbi:transcriptional regulator [Psychromonas marina]|uniref:Transcriptional regulator n=1 Tax=Psychromonas marina TaxID=88364 RepID=A0ABQ6E3S9_9GAMM|nr:LysR family transcriptional regulator [Psychromonas marina]GLS92107.1 transcriptional regulator [Psychromonas marina]
MKIEDLKLFTVVVELGSFSAAAHALELPRANVSRRINELENELDSKLFFRTTRKISLTPHGEVYYNELLDALASLEKANNALQEVATSPKGTVKVGLLPQADYILQDILFGFQDKYPDISLDLRTINNGFIDIHQQGLDIALHGGETLDSDIVARKMLELQRIMVASPEYLANAPVLNALSDIDQHKVNAYRWPSGDVDNYWKVSKNNTLRVNCHLISGNMGLICQAAISGRGISFVPELLVREALNNGSLVHVLPHYQSVQENVWLLYPEVKGVSQVSRLLIDYLTKEMLLLS